MKRIKGRLHYLGWENSWRVISEEGEIEIREVVEDFLLSINGKQVRYGEEKESCILSADPDSEFIFYHQNPPEGMLEGLTNTKEEMCWTNLNARLERILTWLNGRLVEIEIDEGQLRIEVDPSEKVFGVYFTEGNSCTIPEGSEKTVCKVGEEDDKPCLFVSLSKDDWRCEKFNDWLARTLLDRLAKGETNTRIGSCALLGREEEPVAEKVETP